MVSSAHNVCPKGYYIAIVSTIAEGDANHHLELEPGFERLGAIEEKFFGPPIPIYEPLESGEKDNIFISKSYDATSHFETTTGEYPFRVRYLTVFSNLLQTMCATSTSGRQVKSWLWRVSARTSSSRRSRCVPLMQWRVK